MSLSFREKSLWVVSAGLVGTFALYFAGALAIGGNGIDSTDVGVNHAAMLGVATVILVVTQIVGHAIIAIVDRRTETDERDRLIALKGSRNGGFVLAIGAFAALTAALLTKGNFVCSHVLLGFWVLAQLTENVSQLASYRRGA